MPVLIERVDAEDNDANAPYLNSNKTFSLQAVDPLETLIYLI